MHDLSIEFCPFCVVRALVYDNDTSLMDAHLKRAHGVKPA